MLNLLKNLAVKMRVKLETERDFIGKNLHIFF